MGAVGGDPRALDNLENGLGGSLRAYYSQQGGAPWPEPVWAVWGPYRASLVPGITAGPWARDPQTLEVAP